MTRRSDALAAARGEVRDGAASIEHFREVLASRRVGPRALARALPEVHAGCVELGASLAALTEALALELEADPIGQGAVRALLEHARARVAELAGALPEKERKALEARDRLALEAVVRRVAAELATVVRLVELLGARVISETTPIDLTDAIAGAGPAERAGATRVVAEVEDRTSELRLGDARLVLELLGFAVASVVRAGVAAPRIIVEGGIEGHPVLTVCAADGAAPAARGRLEVLVAAEVPHEMEVARAAARHAGITLTIAPDGRSVTIAL